MANGLNFNDAILLTSGVPDSGRVSPLTPNIYFKFDVVAGETYHFFTNSNNIGDDLYAYLYDNELNQIAYNDDDAGDYHPLIQFTATETTTMYAMVRAYYNHATSNFLATFGQVIEHGGGTFKSALPIVVNVMQSLNFYPTLSTIYFRANLTLGNTYTFKILDVYAVELYDEYEGYVDFSYENGDGYSLVNFVATTRTMYIRARTWHGTHVGGTPFDVLLNESDPTVVKSLTVSPYLNTIKIGKTIQLTADVQPITAIDKTVTWTSTDTTVAIVDENGLVTSVSIGETRIIAKTNDGEIEATAYVDVVQWNGGGTWNDPYLVSNIEDLNAVRTELSAHYKQITDIDLTTIEKWDAIGDNSGAFKGSYDGDGYQITNLKRIDNRESTTTPIVPYVGLFGLIYNATLENIIIDSAHLEPFRTDCGALVGYAYQRSTINNCVVRNAKIFAYLTRTGAMIGGIESGTTVSNCHTLDCEIKTVSQMTITGGTIFGEYYVGGLVGVINQSNISQSDYMFYRNSATNIRIGALISSADVIAGGLIGAKFETNLVIRDCFAIGGFGFYDAIPYSASSVIGGIVGQLFGDSDKIKNCYAVMYFKKSYQTLPSRYGGLIGYTINTNETINVINSYYDSDISGFSIDDFRGTSKSTSEMMQESTFVDWDFKNIWQIGEGETYPDFRDEVIPIPFVVLDCIRLDDINLVEFSTAIYG